MTEHQLLLASAYLDDELTADDRAQVENDPVMMELVDQMAAVQQTMRVTTPVFMESTMSSQIQRAISERSNIDVGSEHPTETPASNIAPVVQLPQPSAVPVPSSNTRWLAVAAGVLAIGLLGALAVSALRSTTNDLSDAASATTGSASASESSSASEGSSDAQMSEATMAEGASATTAAAAGSPSPSMVPSMDETFASDDPIVITNSADLLEVGRQLLEPESLLSGAPRPETTCTVQDKDTSIPILAEATLIDGSTTKQIYIATQLNASASEAQLTVYGVDPESCAVLMSTTGRMER